MAGHENLELERRIHALLCGELAESERLEALARLARDEAARATLREMIDVRRAVRAAYGYDPAEDAARDSWGDFRARFETGAGAPRRLLARLARPRWPLRAAAFILLAAAVFVAATAHRTSRMLRQELARIHDTVSMPPPSTAELALYRTIWNQVADRSGRWRPWVLLSGEGGEFGYLLGGPSESEQPLLLRCRMLGPASEVLETLEVMVPAGSGEPISLPDIARVKGRPVRCEVSAEKTWVALGLTVGENAAEATGVRGRVAVGAGPVDLGQFRVDGGRVQVVLQVVPLTPEVH